jgi:hypothetical protein
MPAARSDPAIYYAPAENLEHVDVALIDGARHDIDLAAYVLTDGESSYFGRMPPQLVENLLWLFLDSHEELSSATGPKHRTFENG